MKAVEEFAAECSIVKIFASEMLDYVVDEAVQIHGGYGYHQDYAVERAYRDARINRIFEGTNEINRLLVTGMLLGGREKGILLWPLCSGFPLRLLGWMRTPRKSACSCWASPRRTSAIDRRAAGSRCRHHRRLHEYIRPGVRHLRARKSRRKSRRYGRRIRR